MEVLMVIIWRPYISVEESVKTFDTSTLYQFTRIQMSKILNNFAYNLHLSTDPYITSNMSSSFVDYYWNEGKPYLKDLLNYYKLGTKEWQTRGGEPSRIISKEILNLLKECEYAENTAPWTGTMARNHRYLLLNNYWFWYKRFFREEEEYTRKLTSVSYFENEKPFCIPKAQVPHLTVRRETS